MSAPPSCNGSTPNSPSAKNEADEANLSKTRFLAAASHDILQPLNAARLYASSLSEGARQIGPDERADLARNVDVSLEAVEEILGALLDISRLDAGAMRPEVSDVPMADLMRKLEIEFAPLARSKGLDLRFARRRSPFAPTGGSCAACCRTSFPTRSNIRSMAGCWSAAGGSPGAVAHRGLGHRARHPGGTAARGVRRSSSGSIRARGSRAGSASACRSSSGSAACSIIRSGLRSWPGKGSVFFVTAPLGAATPVSRGDSGAPEPVAAGEPLHGLKILAIDNEPRVLEGMRTLLERWGCVVATATAWPRRETALARLRRARRHHRRLSSRSGRRGRGDPRAARGPRPPASRPILATADRSPEVRDEAARADDIVIMNKPLKPAPLRAQLTRYGAMREAAE